MGFFQKKYVFLLTLLVVLTSHSATTNAENSNSPREETIKKKSKLDAGSQVFDDEGEDLTNQPEEEQVAPEGKSIGDRIRGFFDESGAVQTEDAQESIQRPKTFFDRIIFKIKKILLPRPHVPRKLRVIDNLDRPDKRKSLHLNFGYEKNCWCDYLAVSTWHQGSTQISFSVVHDNVRPTLECAMLHPSDPHQWCVVVCMEVPSKKSANELCKLMDKAFDQGGINKTVCPETEAGHPRPLFINCGFVEPTR